MVRRLGACFVLLSLLSACDFFSGPNFFNAASDEVEIKVTFSNGTTWSFPLEASGSGIISAEGRVIALEVDKGGRLAFKLSGKDLPPIPSGLNELYEQMWEITDDGVCVLPERDFHHKPYPKCPPRDARIS